MATGPITGKSDAFANALMLVLFNNDHAGWAAATNWFGTAAQIPSGPLYISLHSADPGETGTQATSEVSYTTYARQSITRADATGWAVNGTDPKSVTNVSAISFPTCTAGSAVATHFGVGLGASGATELMYSGALSSGSLNIISTPVQIAPVFAAGALTITED